MSRILYRAKSARGDDVADFVEASSSAEAMRKLVGMGLKDIVLLQSPDIAAIGNTPLPGITPQQQARLRAELMDKPGLATALRGMIRINAALLELGAGLLFLGAVLHVPILASIGGGLFLLPFAMFFWKRRQFDRYQALMKAYARGQWDIVRQLAPLLRSATGSALLPFDLDMRLACIDARQGRLQEAVAMVEPWRHQLEAKAPGMFEGRLASVYFAAGDYAEHLRLMEAAAELGKQEPTRLVDLALAHAKFGDARKSSGILASIDVKLLPPVAHKFLAMINGLVLLREGQPDKARADLQSAAEGFLESSLQSPAAWVALAIASGYHAVALARCGKRDDAQRAVAEVMPILLVHGEKPLLDMLQNEVLDAAP